MRGDAVDRRAVQGYVPVIGRIESGKQVEEGGLAGTVRADQRGDSAALNTYFLNVDCGQTTELTHNILGDEDLVGLRTSRSGVDVVEYPSDRVRDVLEFSCTCTATASGGAKDDLVGVWVVHGECALVGVIGHRGPSLLGCRTHPADGTTSTT